MIAVVKSIFYKFKIEFAIAKCIVPAKPEREYH